LLAWIIGPDGIFTGNPLFHILAGGLMLGAIFMATDYTTSPMTKKGTIIYAVGCGVLTMLFRLYTNMPEGVSYAILLMNVSVPMIDRCTKPARFGGKAHV
jgi:electron transport complex protein RnfD